MNNKKTINEISNILIDYIENNKYEFGIGYEYSIGTLKELLTEIETNYKNLGLKIEENGDK